MADSGERRYVAYADASAGRVIGVYRDRDRAEAACFRFSKSKLYYADGLNLEVLEFVTNRDGEVPEADG